MKVNLFVLLLCLVACACMASAEKPEKITFIHYKDGSVKVAGNPGASGAGVCYKLLGANWLMSSLPVSYVINPRNSGLDETFVGIAISSAAEEWDSHTNKELFNDATVDYTMVWNSTATDGKNVYVFGSYPKSNVIAITNIWGFFSGSKVQKRIVEYDVLFNTYYTWGDAMSKPSVMDLQNIATHETGHGIGLSDLYNKCIQETMYGYSSNGETKKRDLNPGDIAGLQSMYGA